MLDKKWLKVNAPYTLGRPCTSSVESFMAQAMTFGCGGVFSMGLVFRRMFFAYLVLLGVYQTVVQESSKRIGQKDKSLLDYMQCQILLYLIETARFAYEYC